MKLSDIATIERARKGKLYPPRSFGIQLSASRGQTEWFEDGGEVEAKYGVVTVDESIVNAKLVYHYVKETMPKYRRVIQTGINFKLEEIMDYPIKLPI